jgi:hypothetical protein
VLSLAILASFFLPLSNAGSLGINIQISAWDVLAESVQNIGSLGKLPGEYYVLIGCFFILLAAAVTLLVVSVLRKSLMPVISFIPFFVVITLLIFAIFQSPVSASETFQTFGTGFYIMLVASFLLLFSNISDKDMAAA